jgi:hypothetical protein
MMFLFAACSLDGEDGFLSGSGRYEPEAYGNTDTGDTADTASGDSGGGSDEGAPVLGEIALDWTEFPNYGIVLEVTIEYTDEGDDILGGVVYADIFQPGDSLAYSGILDIVDIEEVEEPTPETCYVITEGTIYFAIDNLDETEDTWMTLEAKDASNNVSSTYEAAIDGE